jgi:hypothetical protein
VIGTDCTGSCKSSYHAITTAPMIVGDYSFLHVIYIVLDHSEVDS